jgi:hypothetical protein
VRVTRKVVEMAHACGVSVEGEIGCLGSLETGMAGEEDGIGAEGKLSHDQMLTDPEEAARFVEDTGVDALAIADRHQPRRLQVHAASPQATSWRSTASRKSTSASPTRTW